jgi:hypothetical protein
MSSWSFFATLLIPFFELLDSGDYWGHVFDWFDNPSYVQVAKIIRSGRFPGESRF